MQRPEVSLARAPDGTYLAYQCVGSGPIDIFVQDDTFANVDLWWDSLPNREWVEGLGALGRVILHDKRGTGLSSRNVAPGNLETQVADILTVLDALGVEQVVLGGVLEAGAANVLLAATYPSRVKSLFWAFPTPRTTATTDYPWGMGPEYVERELAMVESWGTPRWRDDFMDLNEENFRGVWGTEEARRFILRASLHTCTPDVQAELSRIWYDTDVRGALPSVQAPTLLLTTDDDDDLALARSVAAKIPHAEIFSMPNLFADADTFPIALAEIGQFVGAERPLIGMHSVLATVLFTDIVNSTQTQAELRDAKWKELIEAHHAVVRSALGRWRGAENDTAGDGFYAAFDGPARAIRCGLEITSGVRELGLEVRAGVHTGECEVIDGKYGGLAVTTGARISAAAGPSQVLVSQTVKDLVAGSGLSFHDSGVHTLKGIPDSWHLYTAID